MFSEIEEKGIGTVQEEVEWNFLVFLPGFVSQHHVISLYSFPDEAVFAHQYASAPGRGHRDIPAPAIGVVWMPDPDAE